MPKSHTEWCQQLVAWRQEHAFRIPFQSSCDLEETRMARWVAKTEFRRNKSMGTAPSQRQLTLAELLEFDHAMGTLQDDPANQRTNETPPVSQCSNAVDKPGLGCVLEAHASETSAHNQNENLSGPPPSLWEQTSASQAGQSDVDNASSIVQGHGEQLLSRAVTVCWPFTQAKPLRGAGLDDVGARRADVNEVVEAPSSEPMSCDAVTHVVTGENRGCSQPDDASDGERLSADARAHALETHLATSNNSTNDDLDAAPKRRRFVGKQPAVQIRSRRYDTTFWGLEGGRKKAGRRKAGEVALPAGGDVMQTIADNRTLDST